MRGPFQREPVCSVDVPAVPGGGILGKPQDDLISLTDLDRLSIFAVVKDTGAMALSQACIDYCGLLHSAVPAQP